MANRLTRRSHSYGTDRVHRVFENPLNHFVNPVIHFDQDRNRIANALPSVTLVQTKQGSLALRQGGFDSSPLSMQFVQVTVERIFGQKGKSICKISASAVERIQSGMANSLAG